MSSGDWQLAGVAMNVSDHIRAWVADQRERCGDEEAAEGGRVRGVENAAADAEKS